MKSSKVTVSEAVSAFCEQQKLFREAEKRFKAAKKEFYGLMNAAYSNGASDSDMSFSDGSSDITCTRIQRVDVTFDADKVERALPSAVAREVVRRVYTVDDMAGLVAYLKTLGADPTIFKSFIGVAKQVDREVLDQFEALGKVDIASLEGCYTTKVHDPYYRVQSKERREDGSES